MADTATQAEADALLAMEKQAEDKQPHPYPIPGGKVLIPLLSPDRREKFMLDINRALIDVRKVTASEHGTTNVVRTGLEELRLDYEDFLRQRRLPLWRNKDPCRHDLVEQRFTTADQVIAWIRDVGVSQPIGGVISYGHHGPGGRAASHEAASGGSISSIDSIEPPPISNPKNGLPYRKGRMAEVSGRIDTTDPAASQRR